MSYRNRISQLEQEVGDHFAMWDKTKPFQPYILLSVSLLTILLVFTPKGFYHKDPTTRQKKLSYAKLVTVWIILSLIVGLMYYFYAKSGVRFWK